MRQHASKTGLRVESLEARLSPSFIFTTGSDPDLAGAEPVGLRDDGTFGPSSATFPEPAELAAWTSHDSSPVLSNGGT